MHVIMDLGPPGPHVMGPPGPFSLPVLIYTLKTKLKRKKKWPEFI